MAGVGRVKEADIRAGVGVSFSCQTTPEARVKLAVVLSDAVPMSRSAGALTVLGDEVWGMFDQAMAHIDMRKMADDFSPSRGDTTKLWLGISFLHQDRMKHPETGIPHRPS